MLYFSQPFLVRSETVYICFHLGLVQTSNFSCANLMQMSLNKDFRSLTLGWTHEKLDV